MRTIVMLGIIAAARAASAQPAAAQAETLFRQGKELLARGQIADACAAFDASEKIEPTTSTLLNQASCREKNGQIATAWGLFVEAARQTHAPADDTEKQMHAAAVDHATKLESHLSTLTISVPEDARVGGLEILRDKDVVDPGAWSKALPIDGGTYRIVARAPGNSEWSTTVTVGNGDDVKTIEIPRLKSAVLHPVQEDEVVDAPLPPPHTPSRLPYYLGAGAVMALGGALTFELVARSTYEQARTAPDPQRRTWLWHRSTQESYAAGGLAIAGAAGLGVAVWMYLHDRRTERAVAIAPAINPDHVGLAAFGHF